MSRFSSGALVVAIALAAGVVSVIWLEGGDRRASGDRSAVGGAAPAVEGRQAGAAATNLLVLGGSHASEGRDRFAGGSAGGAAGRAYRVSGTSRGPAPDDTGHRVLVIRFCFGSSVVAAPEARHLRRIGRSLDSATRVRIVGHADAIGRRTYNVGLSEDRAEAVALALGVTDADVDWYGETRPVADNTLADGRDNAPGRARNRRVRVVIER